MIRFANYTSIARAISAKNGEEPEGKEAAQSRPWHDSRKHGIAEEDAAREAFQQLPGVALQAAAYGQAQVIVIRRPNRAEIHALDVLDHLLQGEILKLLMPGPTAISRQQRIGNVGIEDDHAAGAEPLELGLQLGELKMTDHVIENHGVDGSVGQ